MRKIGLSLWLGLLICGCGHEQSKPTAIAKPTTPAAPADPVQALYDKVRSGSYQISTAIDSIEEVRKATKEIASREQGNTHQALMTITGQLDEAGKALADYGVDPPTFDEFKKDFATQDDRRLKAIDAANEALDDLRDAQDLLGDLLDSHPPEPEGTQLDQADSSLEECVQGVEDAIQSMGGKVNSPDDPNP